MAFIPEDDSLSNNPSAEDIAKRYIGGTRITSEEANAALAKLRASGAPSAPAPTAADNDTAMGIGAMPIRRPMAPINSPPASSPASISPVAAPSGVSPAYLEKARREQGLAGMPSNLTFAQNEAEDRMKNIAGEGAKAQMASAEEQAAAAEEMRAKLAQRADAEAGFQKRHEEIMQKQLGEVQRAREAYKAAGEEDPTKMTSAEGIQAAIAVALGAFGSALTGAPNTALDIINKKLDRKVEQQKIAIEKARGNVEMADSLYGQLRAAGLDHQTAAAGERSAVLDDYKAGLAAISAKAQSPEIKTRYDMAVAAADAEKSKTDVALEQGLRARAYAIQHNEAAAAASGAAAAQKHAEERSDKEREFALKVGEFGLKGQELEEKSAERREARAEKTGKSDEAKAQREQDAQVAAIEKAKGDVTNIVKGGGAGALVNKAAPYIPGASHIPGVSEARENVNRREDFNNQVRLAIGAMYKLGTDSTEPKRKELIEQYAAPYEILASDNEETALQKMNLLQSRLKANAAAKGATSDVTESQRALEKLKAMGAK